METRTVIIIDVEDLYNIKESDAVLVQTGTTVVFQIKRPNKYILPLMADEFFIRFEKAPFFDGGQRFFSSELPRDRKDIVTVAEGRVEHAGDYKFSVGVRARGEKVIEVDPHLIVVPARF